MLKGKTKCTYGTLKIPDINIVAIISRNIKFPLPLPPTTSPFSITKEQGYKDPNHFSPRFIKMYSFSPPVHSIGCWEAALVVVGKGTRNPITEPQAPRVSV